MPMLHAASLTTTHIVLTVALPDRPGALGAVASRIGALGADITDVTIRRDTGTGSAVDEFHLTLPATPDSIDPIALLHHELGEVDGVTVTSWYSTYSCCGTGLS